MAAEDDEMDNNTADEQPDQPNGLEDNIQHDGTQSSDINEEKDVSDRSDEDSDVSIPETSLSD